MLEQTLSQMKQFVVDQSGLGNECSWAWQQIDDMIVRIKMVDPVTIEYAVTDGNETLKLYNTFETFVRIVEQAIRF